MILEYLAIPLLGFFNRIRGGGFCADKLPGRPLLWVAPVILAISYFVVGLIPAAIFTTLYVSWAFPPWGRWQTMGRDVPTGRSIVPFERFVEFLPRLLFPNNGFYSDFFSLFIRNIITLLPLVIVWYFTANVLFIALLFAIAVIHPILYAIAWTIWSRVNFFSPVPLGELLMGTVWGILLVAIRLI